MIDVKDMMKKYPGLSPPSGISYLSSIEELTLPLLNPETAAYLYKIETLLDENLIQRLGEDKIIFGTDYPVLSGKKATT